MLEQSHKNFFEIGPVRFNTQHFQISFMKGLNVFLQHMAAIVDNQPQFSRRNSQNIFYAWYSSQKPQNLAGNFLKSKINNAPTHSLQADLFGCT